MSEKTYIIVTEYVGSHEDGHITEEEFELRVSNWMVQGYQPSGGLFILDTSSPDDKWKSFRYSQAMILKS